MNGELMAAEIREQPEVFARILQDGQSRIASVAAAVRARGPRFVLFIARGTSDHAALYAKYLVETQLGLPAGLTSPSTMTVYDAHPTMQNVLVIAVSQSGSSPDLVTPLERARAGGAITVAMTNAPDSALAQAAEFHLNVLAGPERAVAATKSYTAELLTLYLFIAFLAGRDGAEAGVLPAHAAAILARHEEVEALAMRYRFAEQIVVTARGYNYATAREVALKLMETSYLIAHAFSGGGWHGHRDCFRDRPRWPRRDRLRRGAPRSAARRVPNVEKQREWRERIAAAGLHVTPEIDRFYFHSIYFREPGGILFEIATDGPGFATDEDPAHLGEGLALPPFLEPHRAKIEAGLHPIEPRELVPAQR
jgi:fructoselysine-6-P-deglycase FrlB-like protein